MPSSTRRLLLPTTRASGWLTNPTGYDLTLRAAALDLGFVTEEEFDGVVVDPAKITKPYVAAAK
jgi:fumarate hydratase, class II